MKIKTSFKLIKTIRKEHHLINLKKKNTIYKFMIKLSFTRQDKSKLQKQVSFSKLQKHVSKLLILIEMAA